MFSFVVKTWRILVPTNTPPNNSTRQRKKYPVIWPILLLGTTHTPNHFPVVSSTIAQTGKLILYNLLLWLSRSSKEDRVSRSLLSSTLDPDRAFVQGWGCWSMNLADCEWQSLATESCCTNYSFILLVWVTIGQES